MANSWFRMYSEFATDPKVQMLSEIDQRRLTMIFCIRCNGHVTLQDEEVTFMLRISNDEWQVTKSIFIAKGFINLDNEILNWDKRQFISDSSAERVAKHRAKYKSDVTTCNVTVTPPEQIQNRTEQNINNLGDEKPIDSKSNGKVLLNSCPVDELVSIYHENMPDNPRCKVINKSRAAIIRARWEESKSLDCLPFGFKTIEEGLSSWASFFRVCNQSPFLTGKVKPSDGRVPFVADIDFLFSPSGFARCLENKYHREIA